MKYLGTSAPSMLPLTQRPTVTAGFRWAPLNWPTAYTATMTAMPHPNVITIQPEFWALEWFSSTAATTPSPKRIRIAVPIVSAPMMLKRTPSLLERLERDPGATLRATLIGPEAASQRTGSLGSRRGSWGASPSAERPTTRNDSSFGLVRLLRADGGHAALVGAR